MNYTSVDVVGRKTAIALLAVVSGKHKGQRVPVESSTMVLGSGAACGLVLTDAGISEQHVRIEVEDGSLYAVDLESEHGTFVNGARLKARHKLRVGDHLRLHTVLVDLLPESGKRPSRRKPAAPAHTSRMRPLPKLRVPTKPRTAVRGKPGSRPKLPPSRGPMTLRAPMRALHKVTSSNKLAIPHLAGRAEGKAPSPADAAAPPEAPPAPPQVLPPSPSRALQEEQTQLLEALAPGDSERTQVVEMLVSETGKTPRPIRDAVEQFELDLDVELPPAEPRPAPEGEERKTPRPIRDAVVDEEKPAPAEERKTPRPIRDAVEEAQQHEPRRPRPKTPRPAQVIEEARSRRVTQRVGKMTRRLVEYTSQICESILHELEGAAACFAIDLRTSRCHSLHHIFPNLPRDTEMYLTRAAIDTFNGTSLQKLERYWGGGDYALPSELFLKSSNVLYFMKAVPDKSTLLVLITAKTANQALSWLKLREASKLVAQHAGEKVSRKPVKPLIDQSMMAELLEGERGRAGRQIQVAKPDSERFIGARRGDDEARSFGGDLRNFGLTSVLQLISRERKTGVFQVVTRGRKLSLVFEKGRIATSWLDSDSPIEGLFDLLERCELLNRTSIAKVHRRSNFRNVPLFDALIDSGLVDPDEVTRCIERLLSDRILEAMQWTEGRYTFRPGRHPHNAYCGPLDVERLLFKAALISDELPLIREVIPDDQVRVQGLEPREELEEDLQRFLRRLGRGTVSVATLQSSVPESWFDCLKKLYELHQAGCLQVLSRNGETIDGVPLPPEPPPLAAPEPSESKVTGEVVRARVIGTRLRALRRAAGLSVREASRRAGVEPDEWKKIERGVRHVPRLAKPRILAFLPDASEFIDEA